MNYKALHLVFSQVNVKQFLIGLGIALTSSLYGFCYWLESQDALDRDLPFLLVEALMQRFRDLVDNINRAEQKLENVLLYVDFLPKHKLPIILLKDGSLLILFRLEGFDYEGLSEEEREDFSHYVRSTLEQLPDEGAGFMLSNLLIRDTPKPTPLVKNPGAPPLIQFVQSKKQVFWNDLISKSFSNRILCGLRYYPV